MTVLPGTVPPPLPRTRMLGTMALLALTLHGGALFGFQWEVAPSAARPAPDNQEIGIDLSTDIQSPAPQSPGPQQLEPEQKAPSPAMEQPSPPLPVPRQKQEPVTPQKKNRPPPRTRHAASGEPDNAVKPAATAPQHAPPPARAMQDASQAASNPAPLPQTANPKPRYPELARKRGQQGLVRLLAQVDDKGRLLELSVTQSSGFPLLDDAALKTVRAWRFAPGRRAGEPVAGTVTIPVEFLLTP